MTNRTPTPIKQDHHARLLALLQTSFNKNIFVKMILGKYSGSKPELKTILVRQVAIKGETHLSFVYSYETKDITNNFKIDDGIAIISKLIGNEFKSINLFLLTEDVQVEFSKKKKSKWSSSKASCSALLIAEHNRKKKRLLNSDKPFLAALGVTNERHDVLPSMSRKWKQINKFLEIFHGAFTFSPLRKANDIHVVDFGAGKGYLTFAVHSFLKDTLKIKANTTGIELRNELVDLCNDVTKKLAIDGLTFHQGDISSYKPDAIDIMIALHACDTATDQAICMGIRSGAKIIMCAPCCHKQIRPQINLPEILQPMLKYGIHLAQEAEMLTDSLRALLLEAEGYKTQIFEFISLEHTSKNKMLLAVKHNNPVERTDILEKIKKTKEFYGIQDHCLETLLNQDSTPPNSRA